MVTPNPIENPGAIGGGGALGGEVAMFDLTHTSGTFSTGALGFTPKMAIYSGAVQGPLAEQDTFSHIVGFAKAVGDAIAAGIVVNDDPAESGGADNSGGDDDAIGGHMVSDGSFQTSFSIDLDVTAFAASGVDLTWSGSVTAHKGKLIVIGDVSGGAGDVLGFISTAVNLALGTSDVNKVVRATGGGGGITITLPDPTDVGVIGRRIYVKKVDAGVGAITIAQFAAETIDGLASVVISAQYQVLEVVSDGSNWHIL